MLLGCLIVVIVAPVPFFVSLYRRGRVSRTRVVVLLGLEVALLGIVLTPGITWGRTGDYGLVNTVGSVLFFGGLLVVLVTGVRWWRDRR